MIIGCLKKKVGRTRKASTGSRKASTGSRKASTGSRKASTASRITAADVRNWKQPGRGKRWTKKDREIFAAKMKLAKRK